MACLLPTMSCPLHQCNSFLCEASWNLWKRVPIWLALCFVGYTPKRKKLGSINICFETLSSSQKVLMALHWAKHNEKMFLTYTYVWNALIMPINYLYCISFSCAFIDILCVLPQALFQSSCETARGFYDLQMNFKCIFVLNDTHIQAEPSHHSPSW